MYLREVFDKKYGHDTNSHVVKHKDDNGKDFWAVYNNKGDIVKLFYSAKQAKTYAEKNHDDLMQDKIVAEKWSQKYKDSINCSNPKGFSQKAHCAGKKKRMNEKEYKTRDYISALRQTKTLKKEQPNHVQAAQALALASAGEELSDEQQKALGPYVTFFSTLLIEPRYRERLHSMIKMLKQSK